MAFPDDYLPWGGTAADFIVSLHQLGAGVNVIKVAQTPVLVFDGPELDATPVTDLRDDNGGTITTLRSDLSGTLPQFWVPETVSQVWVQVGVDGPRTRLITRGERGADAEDDGPGVPDWSGATDGQVLALVDGEPAWSNSDSGEGGGGYTQPAYATTVNEWWPSLHAYNVKPSNTARWSRGINRVGRQDHTGAIQEYNEVWIGDSIVGGCTGLDAGPGGTIRFDRLNTIADFSARAIAGAVGAQVAGTGLVRWRDNSRDDARITYSPAPNVGTSLSRSAGQYAEFTSNVGGNQVRVYYYDNIASGATGFSVSVNGASSGSGFVNVVGAATSTWKYVTLDTAISAGQKVRITAVTGTIQFSFVEVKDTTKKVSAHNLAASGTKVVGDWESVANGFSRIRQFKDDTALPFVPDVIHLVLGFFDAADNNTSAFKAALLSMLTNLGTASDIVLHAGPLPRQYRGTGEGGSDPQWWWNILKAIYEVADERDLPLFDANHLTGGWPVLAAAALTADWTAHYLPPVYAQWGRATARLVAGVGDGAKSVSNAGGVAGIWSGTQAAYDALTPKSPSTLYLITD